MDDPSARRVVIAGAGVAGLTAALSFAARGFSVSIFERAARLEEAGAGLQLSPNATRILGRLGVLPLLMAKASRPDAVMLWDAGSLATIARIPLGDWAERRWGAPYLSIHRADLQSALLARIGQDAGIRLVAGADVRDVSYSAGGVSVAVEHGGTAEEASAEIVIGADGVRSSLRASINSGGSRFSGQIAWRATVSADSAAGERLGELAVTNSINAFLAPKFHLIAYPVRSGDAFNLVAFTRGEPTAETWSDRAHAGALQAAMARAAPTLAKMAALVGPWTIWPIHTAGHARRWTDERGAALIGDAAHAATPFAAQGAAMAIEDAETLAIRVAVAKSDIGSALASWERERRPRIARVIRRGAVNRLAWHAAGPAALTRNLFLKVRAPESLAADLDWLYGWEPPAEGSA